MNVAHYTTLSLFAAVKSPCEVYQTCLTTSMASTACTSVVLNCNNMVFDLSYPEMHFSTGERVNECLVRTKKVLISARYLDLKRLTIEINISLGLFLGSDPLPSKFC